MEGLLAWWDLQRSERASLSGYTAQPLLRETSLVVQLGLPMRVQPVSCGIRSDKALAHRKSYQLRQPTWS